MGRKRTHEEFKKIVFDSVGNEYTVIGQYVNNESKIRMKHENCGFEYDVTPRHFIKGVRCPNCFKSVKKTTEEFKREVFDLVGDEYSVLGEYVSAGVKILMKHNKCGREYEVVPSSFLRGRRCLECYKKSPKITRTSRFTTEILRDEIFSHTNGEYELIGEFVKSSIKVSILHNFCGYVFTADANSFLRGESSCPKCRESKKIDKIKSLLNDEYEFMEYNQKENKVSITHLLCNSVFDVSLNILRKGLKCPTCSTERVKKWTIEHFKRRVFELTGNEYEVFGELSSANDSIEMKHNICGHTYRTKIYTFLYGSRCPRCSGKMRKTTEQFKQEVYDLVGNEYTVVGEYFNRKTKIQLRHNKCGNNYYVTPESFLSGERCPGCSVSQGESAVKEFLDKSKIDYELHKPYPDLFGVGGRKLSYDFYIPSYNALIEYQGQQHERPVTFNGISAASANERFERQKEHDRRKKEYAKSNNINLLEIWYYDFKNISSILTKYFHDNQAVA